MELDQKNASTGSFAYEIDLVFGKRKGGDSSLFNYFQQVDPLQPAMISTTIRFGSTNYSFKDNILAARTCWGLNSNPHIYLDLSAPAEHLRDIIVFPGFSKGNVTGIRFRRESRSMSSPWVYGMTQYACPQFTKGGVTIIVEGYGLLFEASRRHTSRNFRTESAKNVIENIANHYGLNLLVMGSLSNSTFAETEQNTDDLAMLSNMAALLNCFWFLSEDSVSLIGRDYAYSQKPSVDLVYGRKLALSSEYRLLEFFPFLSAQAFEAGAERMTLRGIDLDSGEVAEKKIEPEATRLGTLSMNSDQFRSDEGIYINKKVLRPYPKMSSIDSGVILPWKTRGSDDRFIRYAVEQKDFELSAKAFLLGYPPIAPGNVVSVAGTGELLDGNYLVWDVVHEVHRKRGYGTTLTLVRNAIGSAHKQAAFRINTKQSGPYSPGIKVVAELIK